MSLCAIYYDTLFTHYYLQCALSVHGATKISNCDSFKLSALNVWFRTDFIPWFMLELIPSASRHWTLSKRLKWWTIFSNILVFHLALKFGYVNWFHKWTEWGCKWVTVHEEKIVIQIPGLEAVRNSESAGIPVLSPYYPTMAWDQDAVPVLSVYNILCFFVVSTYL